MIWSKRGWRECLACVCVCVYDAIRARDERARRGCERRGSERKNDDGGKRVKSSRMEKKRERRKGEGSKEGEKGPGKRMWREIYPKAPGNRNPRAISIIDSTRFKTPSVDLPLVPLVVR